MNHNQPTPSSVPANPALPTQGRNVTGMGSEAVESNKTGEP